jgi:glycosyltransferase involved in cell wall biosynthesis
MNLELMRNLSVIGHEIHLIISNKKLNHQLKYLYLMKNIKVHRFRLPLQNFAINRFFVYLLSLLRIIKLHRKEKFDLAYSLDINGLFGVFLSKLIGIDLWFDHHGILAEEWKLHKKEFNVGLIEDKLMQARSNLQFWISRNSTFNRTVTRTARSILIDNGAKPRNTYTVGNGVRTDIFKPMEIDYKLVNLDKKHRYISFVGSFDWVWQGVEFLIEASPTISKQFPDVRYLIIGDGFMRKPWEELINNLDMADKFIFTGRVPFEDVPKYINLSTICIALKRPVKHGYSTLKLYEYMACGKPVVATRTGGFEILEENKAGIVVDPNDKHEVANAIINLLSDPVLCKEMGFNAVKLIKENYSSKKVAQQISNIIIKQVRK